MSNLEPVCDRPGCPQPEHGNHYHCGRCTSPKVTSMMGHYQGGELKCRPEDIPPQQPATPECDRMALVHARTQPAGEFLEWLREQAWVLVRFDEDSEQYEPMFGATTNMLLADWQGIDLAKIEKEKQAILKWIGEQN